MRITKTTTEVEPMFSKTDEEYAAIDKNLAESRELFDILKGMETLGEYGTAKWSEVFGKYAVSFKLAHGYRPHWAR